MSAARRFVAPGRVNLIGGHVDYHDGRVVAMATDLGVEAEVTTRDDGRVVLRSSAIPGVVDLAAGGTDEPSGVRPPWGRLPAGVLAELAAHGVHPGGFEARLESTLPVGGGLSSSAATSGLLIVVATALAGVELDPLIRAEMGRRAESVALGVPCGLQDPVAVVWGGVVSLDVRSRDVVRHALPPGVAVVVVDSGVRRTLEGSPWLARRTESLALARRLGRRTLRDATPDEVAGHPLGRHVVTELGRVDAFLGALGRGDVAEAGALMVASHRSSRDDHRSSIPELDVLVEELLAAGAWGARLTGGGFGGCVVALCDEETAAEQGSRAAGAYRARTGREPTVHLVRPAPGAGEVDGDGGADH